MVRRKVCITVCPGGMNTEMRRGLFGADDAAVALWFRHWVEVTFAPLETRLASEAHTGKFCHGDTPGLAVLPGKVRRFPAAIMRNAPGGPLKVPHMGWNQVQTNDHPLWADIPPGSRFYYVHSYYADTTAPYLVAGTTTYGFPFTCAAARDNIFAVQFHPEKSQAAGLRLLANFVNWKP